MMDALIDPEAARDVLGWARIEGGWMPGGFTTKLLDALAHADGEHQALLALGFPALVHAFQVYQRDRNGIARLQASARM